MTLQVIGALCIVIAVLGELSVRDVDLPRLSALRASGLIAVGLAFIVLGIMYEG